MPTYDYICDECKYTFEHFQTMSAKPLTVCPECGGHVTRKIGAGLTPIFKGSGFYETDYKSPVKPSVPSSKKETPAASTPPAASSPAPAAPSTPSAPADTK